MQTYFNTNIPHEIWLQIFEEATTSSTTLASISSGSKTLASISLVCKEWYNLAQDRALLPLPLKQPFTRVGPENNSFVKDSIKTPNLTISHLHGGVKELINVRLTQDSSNKMITFSNSYNRVQSIEMIGNSYLGVMTDHGLRVYDFTCNSEPIHNRSELMHGSRLQIPDATSANGLAYFHEADKKIYIYREEEGKLDIKNLPLEEKGSLRAIALQKDYLATVVTTHISEEKKGALKKMGQAVKGKFKKKKTPEVPTSSTKMVIHPLNGKDSTQEIPLQMGKYRQLSADKSCFAVQNTDEEVMVVNARTSTTYTIPHKSTLIPAHENKFFLKDNYLVTISFEEKTPSIKEQVVVKAWVGKILQTTIELESFKGIDTRGNIAAVLTNDQEISFYNLNNGMIKRICCW